MFAGNIGDAQDFPSVINAAVDLVGQQFQEFRIVIIGEGSKKKWLISEIKKEA